MMPFVALDRTALHRAGLTASVTGGTGFTDELYHPDHQFTFLIRGQNCRCWAADG